MSYGDAHVVPVGDFIEHQFSEDCVCGPSAQLLQSEVEGDAWLLIHHSLDGREARETWRRA